MTRTRRPWGRAGGGQAGLKERPGSRSVERDVCDTVPVLLMANAAAARGIENIMATYGTAQQLPPLGLHRLQKEQQTSLPKIPTFKGQTEIGRRVGGKGGEGKGREGMELPAVHSYFRYPKWNASRLSIPPFPKKS